MHTFRRGTVACRRHMMIEDSIEGVCHIRGPATINTSGAPGCLHSMLKFDAASRFSPSVRVAVREKPGSVS